MLKSEHKFSCIISYLTKSAPKHLREELSQELKMNLYDILKKMNEDKLIIINEENYIFISLRNFAIRFIKKNVKNTVSMDALLENSQDILEEIIFQKELANKLEIESIITLFELAKNYLTKTHYQYFVACFKDGLNQKEIANKYQTTQQNVSKVLQKTILHLKHEYQNPTIQKRKENEKVIK